MRTTLFILLNFLVIQSIAQSEFYYYKGSKIPLTVNTQYAYILSNISDQEGLQKKLIGLATITKFHRDLYQERLITTHRNSSKKSANSENYYAEIKFNNPALSFNEVQQIVTQIRRIPEIINICNSYNNVDNERVSITNYIWAGLKTESEIPLLQSEANKINYAIVGQNPFMPNWVMLCPNENASISQITAANKLFETGLFKTVEPELIGEIRKDCTNDPLFTNQWGLNNTGQFGGTVGMDTRVCAAYALTTGSDSVDIAIVDEGFELNHPDLDGNLQNNGYNTNTATTPSVVFGSHGTACAGIAAAEGNNSLGVTGVAYNADLISVAMQFATATWAQISDGFNWSAGAGGAEILSNSWVWNNPSGLFDAAVNNALTNGRGGLGCVILFAAANSNLSALQYPNNSNEDLIIVGAMSQCGQRKNPASCDGENWGSNYGQGLNVMAPGVRIYTTDRQGNLGYNGAAGTGGNYATSFNGTSSACPHAAGIAALILSVNPCLTQDEVEDIMDITARKVGAYSYIVSGLNPNGLWNNEMGYGLLDADAAVKMAHTSYLQNKTETGTATRRALYINAGNNVTPLLPAGDYNTSGGANVNIIGTYYIDFQPGCDLQGTVDAYLNPACF